jgi:hypothetical protein
MAPHKRVGNNVRGTIRLNKDKLGIIRGILGTGSTKKIRVEWRNGEFSEESNRGIRIEPDAPVINPQNRNQEEKEPDSSYSDDGEGPEEEIGERDMEDDDYFRINLRLGLGG